MKLGEVARFSQLKSTSENGPVVTRKLVTVKTVYETVEASPGSSSLELARAMGLQESSPGWRRVSSILTQMTKAKRPRIKRTKQDGWYRYYPINYKLTTDVSSPAAESGSQRESTGGMLPERPLYVPPSTPADIETLAMKYAWQHPNSQESLKAFVNWIKQEQEI